MLKLLKKTLLLFIALVLSMGGFLSSPHPLQAAAVPADPSGSDLPGFQSLVGEGYPCLGYYYAQLVMEDECWPLSDGSLPTQEPDPALAEVPYRYLRVLDAKVPLYWSVEDAAAGKNSPRRLLPGFDFVSVYNQVKKGNRWYYLISANLWMPGGEAESWNSLSSFQGKEFHQTPDHGFGWVLYPVESQREPGDAWNSDAGGKTYSRYQMIPVYQTRELEGVQWLQIGPREWIPAQKATWVMPDASRPLGVKGSRWIKINLEQQILTVYEDQQLIYATLTATGVPGFWTRPGSFQIESKVEAETMRGSFAPDRSDYYYLEDVPWTIYFDQSRALHGAYWHDQFGTPQSKGCVNLSSGDAHFLFLWAEEGDWVHVFDPSGETPTDPDLYQAGGA